MNAKQEIFCEEYARTGDAVGSYAEAYHKDRKKEGHLCHSCAYRLLQKKDIKDRIKEISEGFASERIANAKEMQEKLTEIIRGERKDSVVITEMTGDGMSQARVVEKPTSVSDVVKAIDKLAHMQGVFSNDASLTVNIPVFTDESKLQDGCRKRRSAMNRRSEVIPRNTGSSANQHRKHHTQTRNTGALMEIGHIIQLLTAHTTMVF